jgi:putative inorganic carbon (HCO3(-)) transporter
VVQVNGKGWRTLGLTLLGLVLAALLAAIAVVLWQRSGPARQGELTYVPLAVDKSLGINSDLSRLGEDERQDALDSMEAAGFNWLRQRFPWDAIEAEQGVYDWAPWDELVDRVTQHNLELVAVLDGSPTWARGKGDSSNPSAPPLEPRTFGDFVEAFAARYGDRIDHYQIWDEPNIAPHWGAREIDPAGYARLLREGAIRVRASDPGAVILLAALAPNVEPGGANMSELLFLDALYQERAAQWFDVVAVQPYSFAEPVDAASNPSHLNWQRAGLLRDVMEAHGDDAAAVWAVAFGVPDVTADAATVAVHEAREQWPWLGPMLWAAWSPEDLHGEYALVHGEGSQGLAYEALRSLATAPPVASAGVYPADHPSGGYDGDWRVTPSGADIGESGDRLEIPFRGRRLDLTVRRGDYRAFLYVTVDGQPANALPRDGKGRAYVVLYDPLQETDTITLARDLAGGEHLVEIVADRGWGQWAIVGWTVFGAMAPSPLWLPIALVLAALGILSLTVAWAWPRRDELLGPVSYLVSRYRALDARVILAFTGAAAALVYAVAGTVPALAALALLALLLVLSPKAGLPLIALALPFYQLGRPLLGKVFSMVEILTVLTAVGWFVSWGLERWRSVRRERSLPDQQDAARRARPRARLSAIDWGVLVLVLVGVVSLSWSQHGRVAARELRTVILEAALFYGLLRVMVRDRKDVWRLADAWVLGGVLIALVGLFQWTFGQNLITVEGVWRVRGYYGSPNNLALYLGKVFPLTVAVVAWGCRGWRRWAYGLAALLVAAVIFLTYSRGAWVVGVPASLLFLVAIRGRRTFAVGAGLFVVLVVVVLLVVGGGRLTSLLDTTAGTTFFRLQLWQSSWAMIQDHPLLGVGLDNFLYAYRTTYVLPTAWEEFNLSHPHNLVLDFWLRLGLPGLIVFFWLVVGFFRSGWRIYRDLTESSERILVLGLMAGMVNLVAHGVVDHAFFLVDLAFIFMLMIALVQAATFEQQLAGSANRSGFLESDPKR